MTDRKKDRHRNTAERKTYMQRYQREYDLKNKYGLSLDQFEAILEAQENKCLICARTFTKRLIGSGQAPGYSVVDHNHLTGAVRGILCNACNVSLGGFNDSVEMLEKAIVYLKTARVIPALSKAIRLNADEMLAELSGNKQKQGD